MRHKKPGAGENLFQFLTIDIFIAKDAAVHPPFFEVDEFIQIVVDGSFFVRHQILLFRVSFMPDRSKSMSLKTQHRRA